MPRVWSLLKEYRQSPPLHLLVRDFVGYKAPEEFAPAEKLDLSVIDLSNPRIPEHIRRDIERRKQNA